MKETMLWEFVKIKLKLEQRVALLFVPESIGSSPGRQGHQMVVSEDATLLGTIGGGGMEYKQVERCKKQLKTIRCYRSYFGRANTTSLYRRKELSFSLEG